MNISPNINMNLIFEKWMSDINLEPSFKNWMASMPGYENEEYSPDTINEYVSALKSVSKKCRAVLNPYASIFAIADVNEYRTVRAKMECSDVYRVFISQYAGTGYAYTVKASLDRYRDFLYSNPFIVKKEKERMRKHLSLYIARESLWATKEEYDACRGKGFYAEFPYTKLVRYEGRDVEEVNGNRQNPNTTPIKQMVQSLRRRGINMGKNYYVYHIWGGKYRYDSRYYTCYANLVMIPKGLFSLCKDHEEYNVMLKYRAFELFGFKPEGEPDPVRPDNYPHESEWNKL